ncbi:MAG: CDP-diacylglycerol--glycerol-3-phosphate 3-phosphatidyltransferase [Treponemataceae bacterium]|nr:CDP-diacylglycerol--glycerol-3-phosphate 3-phosphatidyltransferase [Treponemataceae bacterium]
MTKADKFTTVRLVFAPIFLIIYILPEWFPASGFITGCILLPLLCFAEFTDFLDGFYARKMNNVSDFGKLYDPFADVVLHLSSFFCYVHTGYMSFIVLLLLFYRETGMLFLRMVAAKKGVAVGARKGGKLKTVLYIATSFVCLAVDTLVRLGVNISGFESISTIVITVMSILCVVASYVSFIDYLISFKSIFFGKN